MGDTITISQSPNAETLVLIPDASGASGWTRISGATNHTCIDDPKDVPDDDTTYNYMASNSSLTDRYGFPNHTTEAGTINFVQLYSRARANTVSQHSTGVYREVVYNAGTYYEGTNHGPLTLGYNNYSSKWLTRPWDSAAWTWTNIDGLLAGMRATSPTVTTGVQTTVFRPNAAGDLTELTASAGNNYACVDETPANDDTDYVYHAAGTPEVTLTDLYNIPNHTSETGTINFIEIFTRTRWNSYSTNETKYHRQTLKIGGTEYPRSTFYASTSGYYNRSWIQTVNPDTSVAWTWTDIDNLQIGLDIKVEYGSVRCTQVYVVVNYTESIIPQLRCTQLYASVNYTPSARNLTLSKPHSLERGHAHDVRRTQLRSVSKVGDFGDGDNYLTMSGFESTSAQSRMATLELMFQNGAPITIAGLDDTALNTEYQIADRNYTEHAGAGTIYYEWALKLRKT